MHLKKFLALFVWLLLLPSLVFAVNDEDLLAPDQAFQFNATLQDDKTLSLEWKIAEGYFLYRQKFQFNTDTPGYTLGEAVFPPGKLKHDEFFGEMEVYRGTITIALPIIKTAAASSSFTLRAKSQGCADLGVCYPPHTQTASLTILQNTARPFPSAQPENALNQLAQLGKRLSFGNPEEELLPADQAFAFNALVTQDGQLQLRWDIAENYYLYRDKIKIALVDSQDVQLGAFELPPGKLKEDDLFGKLAVYYHSLDLNVPLLYGSAAPAQTIKLQANFQGCAELGVCYPPMEKVVALELPSAPVSNAPTVKTKPTPPPAQTTASPVAFQSEQDRITAKLADNSFWQTLLFFFGMGLLLAFTPCVFPMFPILSSILVGQGKKITTREALLLSLVYVLAMASVYTLAGVLAAKLGLNLQAAFQNKWVLIAFSTLFVVLSFSMFGFYELQLPASWQAKLAEVSNKQKGGTFLGAAIMGLLSALIIGPCVTAPLVGILGYISQTGDALLGGAALFSLSMGMGTPLLLIGASAGKLLPRAGAWMDVTKAVFGVMLLAVAIWLLERILPATITLVLWATLLIVSAIYMGALEKLPTPCSGWRKLWKGLAVVMLLCGGLLLLGAAAGGKDPLRPLAGLGSSNHVAEESTFKPIKSYADLQREITLAQGKMVMLDFYADWCVSCIGMERNTFPDPRVQAALQGMVLLQADVSANDDLDKALEKQLGVVNPPTIVFFGPDGQERRPFRLVGPLAAADFAKHVQRARQ